MGLFTYRQTKKTKQEVQALRADQAQQATLQRMEVQHQAALARAQELFQQLPPEGKAEYRKLIAAYQAETSTWSSWKKYGLGGKMEARQRELARAKNEVLRKYDLIP